MIMPSPFRLIFDMLQYNQENLDVLHDKDSLSKIEYNEVRYILTGLYDHFESTGWKAKKTIPCRNIGRINHPNNIYPINRHTELYYAKKGLNADAIGKLMDAPKELIKSHMLEWGYKYVNRKWVKV